MKLTIEKLKQQLDDASGGNDQREVIFLVENRRGRDTADFIEVKSDNPNAVYVRLDV